MWVEYGPVSSRIISCTREEWYTFWRALSNPEGEVLVGRDYTFLTGLAGHIQRSGITVEGLPEPDWAWWSAEVPRKLLVGIELRDHQVVAIRKAMTFRRGIIAQCTGAGKSAAYAALLKLIGPPTICITDTINAAEQLAGKLRNLGIEGVGMLGGGRKKLDEHNLVVSDSAYRRVRKEDKKFLGLLKKVRLFGIDEVHHLGSSRTWLEVAAACPAHHRIGLSATPFSPEFSASDLKLLGAMGDVIDIVPSKQLREQDLLAEPVVFMLPVAGERCDPSQNDWAKLEKAAVAEHGYRNQLITLVCTRILAAQPEAKILLLVRRQKHGKLLTTALNEAKVKARFSFGGKRLFDEKGSLHYRSYEDVKEDFKAGEFSVLVGSVVYNESADIPIVTDVVMAAGGRSPRQLLQRLGRGERTSEGKPYVRIWDFWDSQHGITAKQSATRIEVYQAEQIRVISSPIVGQRIIDGTLAPADAADWFLKGEEDESSESDGGQE